MDTINLNNISIIRNIKTLSFQNTTILNEQCLIYLDNIINLDLFNTKIKDISTLTYNQSLKTLIIDKDIYLNNKDIINIMIKNNINILNDSNQKVVDAYE